MAFRTNAAPYQRAKNSTLRIMLILTISLIIVWACGVIYSFQLEGTVNAFIAELNAKARKKIRYNQMGKKLGLSNALGILEELKKDIHKDTAN